MKKHYILLAAIIGFIGGYFYNNQPTKTEVHESMSDSMSVAEHVHTHVELEVDPNLPIPRVDLVMHADPKSGWNAQIVVENFNFAPERASTDVVPGEGHAHIYIDGEKINRVYGEWYHLPDLTVGTHEIMVQLSANDHSELIHNGAHIQDTELITVHKNQ